MDNSEFSDQFQHEDYHTSWMFDAWKPIWNSSLSNCTSVISNLVYNVNGKSMNRRIIISYVLYLLVAIIITWISRKFYYGTYKWKRDLTDIGYHSSLDNEGVARNNRNRVHIINRLRRLRKVGNRIPPPFPNGWFVIMESEALTAGQAKSVNSLGQNFVVFRTQNGDVNILDAYCPHLGANLGVGGIVREDCIECPFHHWSFDGKTGECVNIPYIKTGSIPKVAKLKKWKSIEANGFIFVWHHSDENVVPWGIQPIPEIENDEWVFYGKNEFLVNAHIQDIPENGADIAHLNAVHGPNVMYGSENGSSGSKHFVFGMHAWQANWNAPTENDPSHIAWMDLKHSFRVFNKLEICTVNVKAYQIGPGYVQLMMKSNVGPMVALQSVTPVEPLIQKVIHRFYAPRNFINAIAMRCTIWAESIMFERDMKIWNNKQFIDNPLLIKEDRAIKTFRKWYSQFYSANSVSYASAKQNLDW
ncbi:cholesterol 7-desaturase nvd isoform X2 [Uranotaenia lowii]|uniref:cholesterol 7-desaturase nvd isoform X2 n=1 Tax=Uranotaenia lowii TaxID=190385 RepID=UPI0024792EDD|nr:cholesterol 7-desaturase nvd isoform X2 [Uranotaenia lowii]